MSRLLLFRLVPLFLLLLGAGNSRAQESGVLIGLSYLDPIPRPLPYYAGSPDSLARTFYRTVLVTRTADSFALVPAADVLLIPEGRGFRQAGTRRSVYNDWVEDFAWTAAEGRRARYPGIQPFNGEYCEGHRMQTILYAGPRYLSLEQRSAGYCEGGAHPWFFNTLAVVPVDSTDHSGLDIGDVLDGGAYDVLADANEAFLSQLRNDDARTAYLPEPDPANWGLVRRDGRWTVIGRIESAEAAGQSSYTDLPLVLDVPPALTGGVAPRPDWRQVRAFAPDARDALLAPAGDWLVLLRARQLSVHPLTDGRIGRALITQPMAPGTRVVMARWAAGQTLGTWVQRIERLAQLN